MRGTERVRRGYRGAMSWAESGDMMLNSKIFNKEIMLNLKPLPSKQKI